MRVKVESKEHLLSIIEQQGDKAFKVLITRPETCQPCRMLEHLLLDKETDEDFFEVNIFGKDYNNIDFLKGVYSVPSLIESIGGVHQVIANGIAIKDKIEWSK